MVMRADPSTGERPCHTRFRALVAVVALGAAAPQAGLAAVQDQASSTLRPDSSLVSCPLPVPQPTSSDGVETGAPPPAWDLRCIELIPAAAGGDARGVVSLARPASPFGVTVTPQGRHVHGLSARLEGLPDPAFLGPYTTFVAWATPPTLDPVVRLGEVGEGTAELGTVAFSKYLVLVSAEVGIHFALLAPIYRGVGRGEAPCWRRGLPMYAGGI